MDIKAFYPSIRVGHVNKAWLSLGCSEPVAGLLTRLTTCDYQLPQGFRSSQGIANLVRRPFDLRVQRLADERRLTYTNYSDNLFLSGARIPSRVVGLCESIASTYGWRLHKVEIKGRGDVKHVLGIQVGEVLDVTPEYHESVLADIARLRESRRTSPRLLRRVAGRIAWVQHINPEHGRALKVLAGIAH